MNRRPSGSMPLSKAAVGFINHKLAEGLTERSVISHRLASKYQVELRSGEGYQRII